jgi:ATP/maltotriose-dependent transcriptional regulator MalT
MHLLFANAALADLARRTGDLAEARRLRAEALESLRRMPQAHPVAGHLAALALATAARLSVAEGDLDIAREHLSQARENAVGTKDMAIIAHVAVAVAAFRHARGDFAAAATLLGAAARLRGSPDATDPDVAALTLDLRRLLGEAGFAADYDVGRTMPPDAAIGLLSRADA